MPQPGGGTRTGRDTIPHLWIVSTDPALSVEQAEGGAQAILVSVTDSKNHPDRTLLLRPGDHPFIYKESIVLFAKSLIVSDIRKVQEGIDKGYWPQQAGFSAEIVARIQRGILKSPYTPDKAKRFLERQLGATGVAGA